MAKTDKKRTKSSTPSKEKVDSEKPVQEPLKLNMPRSKDEKKSVDTNDPKLISQSGRLFLVHLLIGFALFLVSIFISNVGFKLLLTLLAPMLIMMSYFFIAGSKKSEGHSSNFADSIYYLGFIFTLCALLVSFVGPTFREALGFTSESGAHLRSGQLLEAFGMALITTLIGLTCRTVIIQSQSDPFEQINDFENDLHKYGQEATRQMHDSVVFFKGEAKDLQFTFHTENKKFIAEMNAQTGQVHKGLMAQYLSIYKNLSSELKKISEQAMDLTEEQVEYKKDIFSLRTKIASMEGNLAERLKLAFSGLGHVQDELETKVGEITAAVDKGADAINRSVEPIELASESMVETTTSMASAASNVLQAVRMTGELESNIGQLKTTIELADNRLQTSLLHLDGRASEIASELSGDTDKAFSELSLIIEKFASSIAQAKRLL